MSNNTNKMTEQTIFEMITKDENSFINFITMINNENQTEFDFEKMMPLIISAAKKKENCSYGFTKSLFRLHEKYQTRFPFKDREHLTAHITFTEDSFIFPYLEEERTYVVSSDNKAYLPNMSGYSIFGNSLDGNDCGVRLEQYMREERGGNNGWEIEKIKII